MKLQFLKDMLKSRAEGSSKYSQGRVYLFVFVLSYLLCLGYFMFKPNKDSMMIIIDSLQWAILLFATYVFGDKGILVTSEFFKSKNKNSTSTTNLNDNLSKQPSQPTNSIPDGKKEENLCT